MDGMLARVAKAAHRKRESRGEPRNTATAKRHPNQTNKMVFPIRHQNSVPVTITPSTYMTKVIPDAGYSNKRFMV